eukprot:TRINITY_DN2602_c0_g1_i2.p2 TRINITY_DN2602_c0_g1~~TRINITY_DN2602_c0_g1_i2.p2  ORF type:complete len:233 (-),score=23.78 TRINITY_DN2602_c0_g1_i2:35-670(-)
MQKKKPETKKAVKTSAAKKETKKVITKKEVKKEQPAPPKETKEKPLTVSFTDLASFMKEPHPANKWYTFIDGTKGNVTTFFKYTGHVLFVYSEDDMKDEKLNNVMKSVATKGMKLYFDFMDAAIQFENFIHPGALPPEIFFPEKIHSMEFADRYRDPNDTSPILHTGEIGFIFTSDKALPQWVKDHTVLVYVNPQNQLPYLKNVLRNFVIF